MFLNSDDTPMTLYDTLINTRVKAGHSCTRLFVCGFRKLQYNLSGYVMFIIVLDIMRDCNVSSFCTMN